MSKYLTKLKVGPSNASSALNIKFNFTNMSCGNGYKEGLLHRFETYDSEDVSLLIDIIKRFRFKTIITNVTDNSFEFENKIESVQVFFFRICRYTRTKDIRKILEDTIMMNKLGVTIQNAFLLAHYYNWHKINTGINQYYKMPSYYTPIMDGFYDPSVGTWSSNTDYLNKPFKTLTEFHKFFGDKTFLTYNHIYMYVGGTVKHGKQAERKKVFELLEEKKFKTCERYLKSVFFK